MFREAHAGGRPKCGLVFAVDANEMAALGESAFSTGGYAHLSTSHTAVQFWRKLNRPAQASRDWSNTKSNGANTYGHTKEGAYMCEADATAEGNRLSKNGHYAGPSFDVARKVPGRTLDREAATCAADQSAGDATWQPKR